MTYKLLTVEGSGAYGTVAKAREARDQRRLVALKILRERHLDDPRVLSRTRDEAKMLSRIDHPGIVKVYELVEHGDRPVMVMEWLEALSVGEVLDVFKEGLPVAIACEIASRACMALDHAYTVVVGHRPLGLVHRDLKPSNMLLTIDGELKLVDFGLAHVELDDKESQTVSIVLGTRAYMAPERFDGADDHPSSDVFSVGLMLYEMLTGRLLKPSLNPKHHEVRVSDALETLNVPDLPSQAHKKLSEAIRSMCAYEPEDRPSHRESAHALHTVLALGDQSADLHAFARAHVHPRVMRRQRTQAHEHRDYPSIQFVETSAPAPLPDRDVSIDPAQIQTNDDRIRKLLTASRWSRHLPELRKLVQSAAWSAAPFIEVLDAIEASNVRDTSKIAMCINLLRRRPTSEAVERIHRLQRHPDALIANTARQFIEAIPG
jgi:serine/threonine protein kinase